MLGMRVKNFMKEVLGKKNIFMLRVAKEEFFAFFLHQKRI